MTFVFLGKIILLKNDGIQATSHGIGALIPVYNDQNAFETSYLHVILYMH